METSFIVRRKFIEGKGEVISFENHKLHLIETPYGRVVALELDLYNSYSPYLTVVPGFYRGLQPFESRMEVDTVPQDKQKEISEILRQAGYRRPIEFW